MGIDVTALGISLGIIGIGLSLNFVIQAVKKVMAVPVHKNQSKP